MDAHEAEAVLDELTKEIGLAAETVEVALSSFEIQPALAQAPRLVEASLGDLRLLRHRPPPPSSPRTALSGRDRAREWPQHRPTRWGPATRPGLDARRLGRGCGSQRARRASRARVGRLGAPGVSP